MALAITLPALTSCGSDSTGSPASTTAGTSTAVAPTTTIPAAPPAPCSLVSKDQAEQLAATPLNDATTTGTGDTAICRYTSLPTASPAQVDVRVGAGAKQTLDADRKDGGQELTPLTGVGDEAYVDAGNLFVRTGTLWVSVSVVAANLADSAVQAGLTAFADTLSGAL